MIIDHVDQLELADHAVARYGNELRSLNYLAQGLGFLYGQVKRIEDHINEAVPHNRQVLLYGNAPQLRGVPLGLVACAFHWYSVSACNYAKMVGWLVNGGNSAKAVEYVQRVLPAVYIWRNKVGAHFARTAPRKEDTPADLAMSVMFPVAFCGGAFHVNAYKLAMTQGGQASASHTDMQRSLTHTHRELSRRYWPDTLANSKSQELDTPYPKQLESSRER